MKFFKTSLIVLSLFAFVSPSLAHKSPIAPVVCTGSGLGINLYSNKNEVNIGDTISYSITIFDGIGSGPIVCDITGIQASITTPDGQVHPIALWRTISSSGVSDDYANVVTYTARSQDVSSGMLATIVNVSGTVHQNDTDSQGSAYQGVNTTIIPTVVPPPPAPPAPPEPTPSPEIRSGGGGSIITPVITPVTIIASPTPIVVVIPTFPNTGFAPEEKNTFLDFIIRLWGQILF